MTPLEELQSMISQFGWAVRNVQSSNPAECVSYTVGLSAHDHPEVVMTGLPSDVATPFLNIAGHIVVREHGKLKAGALTTEFADGPAMPIIEVDDTTALTAVRDLFGEVSAVQIIWTDSQGHLPWDVDYANPEGSQPLLGKR